MAQVSGSDSLDFLLIFVQTETRGREGAELVGVEKWADAFRGGSLHFILLAIVIRRARRGDRGRREEKEE